jgi:di/tricarboxylate transporter
MAGPGAILATALVAPFAMTTGSAAGVPPFLIALLVANGANAGNLSPFSTIGAIVSGLMTNAGLGGHEFRVWFFHGLAHVTVASVAFCLFGGLALSRCGRIAELPAIPTMERKHALTLAVTAAWIGCVILFRLPLGWPAFAAAGVLFLMRAAAPMDAVRRMPWKTIALVVTISGAIGMLERAGGLRWFQDLITRLSTPQSVHAVVAALTGLISAYSSTSGVVLPAFLPLAPGLAARLPGTDAFALSVSINIGSALVDVSPLSTLGALCIAAAPAGTDVRRLYRNLMLWGFAMVPVGAVLCYFGAPYFKP